MSETITYRGWLVEASNGEEDVLALTDELFRHRTAEFLADEIESDIRRYGRFLSVRYYITDAEIAEDAIITEWLNTLEGIGDAEYGMRYSDITGYLWTDEEIKVGGHDLLNELRTYVGKFCHLVIEYNEKQGV